TTGNTRNLLLGSGDSGALLAANMRTAPNIGQNTPTMGADAGTAFNTAITNLIKRYQQQGTGRFAQQGFNAQDLQNQRISAAPSSDLVGASPGLQAGVRDSSAAALSPTISGASSGAQTF